MRRRATLVVVLAALAASAVPAGAGASVPYHFPVNGPFTYGDLGDTGFGVSRPDGSHHLGQDMMADCGTPLVAVHRSVVRTAGYSEGYGNFVVLTGVGTRFDFTYAHMRYPSRARKPGKKVKAGRVIGFVGQSGSDGGICHLHFELWNGRWFDGGRRINPLPHLRVWNKSSGGKEQPETEPAPVTPAPPTTTVPGTPGGLSAEPRLQTGTD
jgi:murein DD-endopeptidase MepM/ murein hydrolase activator NlpD